TIPVQPDATMRLDDIRAAIRPDNAHFPPTRLIMLENTHNAAGGQPITVEYTNQVAAIAKEHGIKLHIDGARIFNAAAALGVDVKALTEHADSVTFCLSKGLCAPVGSVIVGSRDFIKRAHRMRKVVGGAMRQAGVLAAAGLVALRTMPQRLHEDHTHAALLAEGLSEVPHVKVLSNATNFVFITLGENSPYNASQLSEILKRDYNIIISPYPGVPNKIRLVTHYWITRDRVEQVIEAFKAVLS
ncbi:MAG: aminotransferase class I/II-fold pyridoxal phosphate-dependent enzyme, partial [Chloroflexi bacterium]